MNRSASAVRCFSGSWATRAHRSPSTVSEGACSSVDETASATASGAGTGTARRARERAWSITLRCAIVSSQARRFDASRSFGYARSADSHVSW